MRPKLSKRQIRRLQTIVLEQDFAHAPVSELGARHGVVLPAFIPHRQEIAQNWRQWLLLQLKLRWRHRCIFPMRECRAELIDFSAAVARWLVQLSRIDPADKYNIIAIEKAFVALKTRVEQGALGYRAEFAPLFRFYVRQQLGYLDRAACRRISEHAGWLLVGKDDGVMRSLAWRNEFRRNGFGLFEDLLRHMPAVQFSLLMREHKELDEIAPALFAWLRDEAEDLGEDNNE